ncbi:hypothetical protein EVAR_69257_1 [Eumeta japonica]|uniref:Uncharacterized protein n=1 Tax=Eumeta variegata TaxID=151549 RepID=A0A4C1SXA9_EUMVA|nr:hypothetical protein EVAR_69257_1 [Eumeta japonica]
MLTQYVGCGCVVAAFAVEFRPLLAPLNRPNSFSIRFSMPIQEIGEELVSPMRFCRTSAETTRFLEGQRIELTGDSPYSFYLTPNGSYLFPSMKNELRSQRFLRREEAVDTHKVHVLEIPQSE